MIILSTFLSFTTISLQISDLKRTTFFFAMKAGFAFLVIFTMSFIFLARHFGIATAPFISFCTFTLTKTSKKNRYNSIKTKDRYNKPPILHLTYECYKRYLEQPNIFHSNSISKLHYFAMTLKAF